MVFCWRFLGGFKLKSSSMTWMSRGIRRSRVFCTDPKNSLPFNGGHLLNFTPGKRSHLHPPNFRVTRKNLVGLGQKSLTSGSWRQVTQWNFLSCSKRRCRTSPGGRMLHLASSSLKCFPSISWGDVSRSLGTCHSKIKTWNKQPCNRKPTWKGPKFCRHPKRTGSCPDCSGKIQSFFQREFESFAFWSFWDTQKSVLNKHATGSVSEIRCSKTKWLLTAIIRVHPFSIQALTDDVVDEKNLHQLRRSLSICVRLSHQISFYWPRTLPHTCVVNKEAETFYWWTKSDFRYLKWRY